MFFELTICGILKEPEDDVVRFVRLYSPEVSAGQQVCQGLCSDATLMGTISSVCVLDTYSAKLRV